MAVKFMVAGDRLPVLRLEVEPGDDDDLAAITTATPVTIRMRRYGADTPTIDNGAATVTSVEGGIIVVDYEWDADDTATPGDYKVETTFTIAGRPLTVPADTPAVLRIRARA